MFWKSPPKVGRIYFTFLSFTTILLGLFAFNECFKIDIKSHCLICLGTLSGKRTSWGEWVHSHQMRPNPLRIVPFQRQTATAPPKVFRKGEHIFLHFFHSTGVQVPQVNPFTKPGRSSGCSSLSWSAVLLPLSLSLSWLLMALTFQYNTKLPSMS